MKAKFVYKNMKFERGVDPKAAMGLGMRERIKKMMEEDDWNWNYKDDDQSLRWASKYSHTDIVEFLLKAGVDIHAYDDDALAWACHMGHINIVKLLLEAGANPHAGSNWAFQRALRNNHKDIVELLKKYM